MGNVHELNYLKEKIQDLKDQGVYRKLPILEGPNEAEVILNGKKVINLSSNNYLGFANHPRLKKAAIEAVEKYGAGAGQQGNGSYVADPGYFCGKSENQ